MCEIYLSTAGNTKEITERAEKDSRQPVDN